MKPKKKTKHGLLLFHRITIATSIFVLFVAIMFVSYATATIKQSIITIAYASNSEKKSTEQVIVEDETSSTTTPYGTEAYIIGTEMSEVDILNEKNEEATSASDKEEMNVSEVFQYEMMVIDNNAEKKVPKNELHPITNLKKNLSEWCLANDNTNYVSIWKMTDKSKNLYISLCNTDGEVLVTFKFDDVETGYYGEWTCCDDFFNEITIRDIVDYSYVGYHEVSGKNPENVQTQVAVLINRQNHEKFPDSARSVITQPEQYACARSVIYRLLKSNNYLEQEDLEKCFKQVLLYLAGEYVEDVPENVGFAAPRKQGSGIWKIIDGTYYCFFY